MEFSSLFFLFLYLPLVLCSYFLCPERLKKGILFVSNLIFCLWNGLTDFLWFVCLGLVNYYASKKKQPAIIDLLIIMDLGVLLYFKLYPGILEAMATILPPFVLPIMPLGFSFYTFTLVSYLVDLKHHQIDVPNLIDYFNYLLFFPKLIMGPITRFSNFKKGNIHFHTGAKQLIDGLGYKMILSTMFYTVFQSFKLDPHNFVESWVMICSYSFYLYFDFAGYSKIACGIADMLGYQLPLNFDYPYLSHSIREFWHRWHMSLGAFFLDYVYIPLGGSRLSNRRTCFNLLVVWLFTGLWHGTTLPFLVWGLYHYFFIVLERFYIHPFKHSLFTFFLVSISWIFFFSPNLNIAGRILLSCMNPTSLNFHDVIYYAKFALPLFLLGTFVAFRQPKKQRNTNAWLLIKQACILYFVLCMLMQNGFQSFLYATF